MIYKVKLFDELVISEYNLAKIIKNYTFPIEYYSPQLKKLGCLIPKENKNFYDLIIIIKNKIKFRTKNIIFIGYDKNENNKYYFVQITTQKSKKIKQLLYFEHIKGHKTYINLSKIYHFNFNVQKTWLSKFNEDKKDIKQKFNWKTQLINGFSKKNLKKLIKNTNIKIYEMQLKKIDFHV